MGTGISWTDETWVPLTGCTRVSAACDNCYAFALHDRRYAAWRRGVPMPVQYHQPFSRVQLLPERLTEPLRWRRPRRVFLTSMGDLFHDDVPDEFICRVFGTMLRASRHTFQVLTKRPERMAALLGVMTFRERVGEAVLSSLDWDRGLATYDPRNGHGWPLKNVWLGTSIEDQDAANARIPWLLRTPAAVRFLSAEPLLGAINLNRWMGSLECCSVCEEPKDRTKDAPGNETALGWPRCVNLRCVAYGEGVASAAYRRMIHWVICGGESGPHARPMHPEWVRSLRDQCIQAGVPFHFKQWGEYEPVCDVYGEDPLYETSQYDDCHLVAVSPSGTVETTVAPRGDYWGSQPPPGSWWMARVGKRRAGRELDGRTWDEFPAPVAVAVEA